MRVFELSERSQWSPEMPAEFRTPYQLGGYSEDQITNVMWKYLVREVNCERAWARINHHFPETLMADKPMDILELSTAHGAMLEIWQSFGHRCVGTDFNWTAQGREKVKIKGKKRPWHDKLLNELTANETKALKGDVIEGWPYQPIIESLGLDVRLFDGAIKPYPFEDNSFDVVCCFQAIEAYTTPDGWMDTIREFCRISRQSVVVGFNPLPVESAEAEPLLTAAKQAWLEMQRFNECGFKTSFFEIGQTRRGIHPTVCKLVAV